MKTFIACAGITALLAGCGGGLPEATAENCMAPDIGEKLSKVSKEDQMEFAKDCRQAIVREAFKNAQ